MYRNLSGIAKAVIASQPRKLGHIQEVYSLLNNYAMILDWLGISTHEEHCNSPLSQCYRPHSSIPVTDGTRAKIYEYKDLRDTFTSPKKRFLIAKPVRIRCNFMLRGHRQMSPDDY